MSGNSPVQVVRAALRDLADAEVPEELRTTAFSYLLYERRVARQEVEAVGEQQFAADGSSWAQRVAAHLGLGEAQIAEDILHWDGEHLEVVVGRRALSKSRAQAQRELALLVIGAVEALTGEWVQQDAIREACQGFPDVYDRNLAANLRSLSTELRTRGVGTGLMYGLSRSGRDVAASVATSMAVHGAAGTTS